MKHAYRILDPATGIPTETPSYSGVTSERATPETAGPAQVVAAVATCSLPVSAAEALLALWDHLANFHRRDRCERNNYKRGYAAGLTDAYTVAAIGLREHLTAAKSRQPEENTKVSHAHPEKGQ